MERIRLLCSSSFHRVLGIVLIFLALFCAGSARAQSWKKVATFNGLIANVKFLNPRVGFVTLGIYSVSNSVALYKTTDGGNTWAQATIPSGYDGRIDDIDMIDSLHGWIAMAHYNSQEDKALWRTTDAGMTWNETPLVGWGTSITHTPRALILTDFGEHFHISTDGGTTFFDGPMNSTNCVRFVDSLHGAMTVFRGSGWMYSSDGGLTWQNSNFHTECWSVYPDSGTPNFYAAPEVSNILYHSTDYGATWSQLASFPSWCTGTIAGIGDKYLFCQLQHVQTNGMYYSTDKGGNWTCIGGPGPHPDTRFCALTECPGGVTVYAFDDQSPGTLYKYSFGTDGPAEATLALPTTPPTLVQTGCSAVDTALEIGIIGCSASSGRLDSAWLTPGGGDNASAFSISDIRRVPRTLSVLDSIEVSYETTHGPDTAQLHLRYDLGAGVRDTVILLVGRLTSPMSAFPERLHRSSAIAYEGQIDTLPLLIDMNSVVNLDSLWPSLSDIHATFAFDSSVVQFQSYLAPSGWSLWSLTDNGNSVNFEIHKITGTVTTPLDLGTALFSPNTAALATSWVTLPAFSLVAGGKTIALCVTEDEDSHWAVKTLGPQSAVQLSGTPTSMRRIWMYPNPARDRLFIRNTFPHAVTVTIYDAIGRERLSDEVIASTSSTISLAALAPGMYVVVWNSNAQTHAECIEKTE